MLVGERTFPAGPLPYAIAEVKDIAAWIDCFNPDGVFVDESVGVTYRGPGEVGKPVEDYGTAFSDIHREF